MGKGKSFLFGFIAGGVAAGFTVLLSTAKPGREVRYDIKTKWDEANFKLVDMKTALDSVKDSVEVFTNKSIPTIQTTAREMKNIITTWKDDIQPNIQRITSRVKELEKEQKKLSVSE